ncbi:hypothetical protein PC116_g4198 [Phytophthora cactorum]|nr:hypothetical protein PC116_g4198 [Phytophthora cactorum]
MAVETYVAEFSSLHSRFRALLSMRHRRTEASTVVSDDSRASRVSDRFTNPFASLSLSAEAVAGLETLTQTLVARNIEAYERHLHDNSNSTDVDKSRWKLMYEQGGLRSYAERSTTQSFGFGAAMGAAAGHLDRRAPVFTQPSTTTVPSILVVGAIEGELDDTMYGFMCPTLDQMRVKTSLHKLTFVLPDHRLVQQQIALCYSCLANALSVKAVDVARDELKRRRRSLYEWRDTYATSTSSNPITINELN